MRVGGPSLKFINEEPLDPSGNPNDPTSWLPYSLSYREYVDPMNDTGAALPQRLLLTHTMDDGPAPSTFISLDVNFGLNNPSGDAGPDWPYGFQLTNNNAASQPYFDQNALLTSADYEPIYGLGVETWQRYSRFETIGFPIVQNDFSYAIDPTNSALGFMMKVGAADPQGIYSLFTDQSNEYTISHNNVGTDPTNDYLISRAAAVPADVRIEASMFAENGSFFVIPGPPFNPNPNDRRDVFNTAVATYGGFGSNAAVQQAQQERLENFGSFPETPFYGEPLDVRVNIVGSISEAMPASIDQQAQWIKRWGWIPAQLGCEYDFSSGTPRAILIPRSHVPTGYNINPAQPNASLFVPNMVVTYDPILATGKLNGFDNSASNTDLREDKFGRTLPPLPQLPVSPTLAYFGEVNP
jgi:hypothetical protein